MRGGPHGATLKPPLGWLGAEWGGTAQALAKQLAPFFLFSFFIGLVSSAISAQASFFKHCLCVTIFLSYSFNFVFLFDFSFCYGIIYGMAKVRMNVTVDSEIVKRVDKLANELGLSRSQMVENLLAISLEDAEVFKKLGLIGVLKALRDLKEQLETIFSGKEVKWEGG